MQVGIITDQLIKHDQYESISLALVDYKSSNKDSIIIIGWTRDTGDNWGTPKILFVSHSIKHMDTVSKLLGIIVRLKEKSTKVLSEPVNLIRELKKKLARHVVWNGKEYTIVQDKKNGIARFHPETEELCDYTTSSVDEAGAIKQLTKTIAEDSIGNPKVAVLFGQWLSAGAKVNQIQDDDVTITPISAYFRNGK